MKFKEPSTADTSAVEDRRGEPFVESEVDHTMNKKMIKSEWCCPTFAAHVTATCSDHPDRFDCPDAVVVRMEGGWYGLPIRDGGASAVEIIYCPWCGRRVRRSQSPLTSGRGPNYGQRWATERMVTGVRSKVVHYPMFSNARRGHQTACGKYGHWVPVDAAPGVLCVPCARKIGSAHLALLEGNPFK